MNLIILAISALLVICVLNSGENSDAKVKGIAKQTTTRAETASHPNIKDKNGHSFMKVTRHSDPWNDRYSK